MTTGTDAGMVNTVLGPVRADALGVVAVHEALLFVLPGAQFAHDITIDRAEVFETISGKLAEFRAAGGGTVVDAMACSTGATCGCTRRWREAPGSTSWPRPGRALRSCSGGTSSPRRPTRRPPGRLTGSPTCSPVRSVRAWSCHASNVAHRRAWWPRRRRSPGGRQPTRACSAARPALH